MSKLNERKCAILNALHELDRPVWAGDVAETVAEREAFRTALRVLAKEGKIRRYPGAKGARAYYRLELDQQQLAKRLKDAAVTRSDSVKQNSTS